MEHMIRSGAPKDAAQPDGCTGLWLAAEQGHTDVVRLLCEHGANVHQLKQPGDVTPLYIAAQNGHTAVVRLLLDYGAVANAAKASGATPLYIAAQQNFTDIVAALLDAGAAVGMANHQGITPLAIAAFQGHLETVRMLLAAGADPTTKCGGKTTVEWAESNGHGPAVTRLVESSREERLLEQERRQGLARSDLQTPNMRSLQADGWTGTSQRGGGSAIRRGNQQQQYADPAQHEAADAFGSSWYTPKFLVRGSAGASPTPGGPTPGSRQSPRRFVSGTTGLVNFAAPSSNTSASFSHTALSITPRSVPVGGLSSPAAGPNRSTATHPSHYSSAAHASSSGFATGGALTKEQVEEEARRNDMFRRQISKSTTVVAGLTSESSASAARNKASLYEVDQEWSAFKQQLSAQQEFLEESQHEVQHGWMYSTAAMTQYEDTLRKMRQQQREAIKANAELQKQNQDAKEKNSFSYPPLPQAKVDALRKFVAQGAAAKGPPPPPAGDEGQEPAAGAAAGDAPSE